MTTAVKSRPLPLALLPEIPANTRHVWTIHRHGRIKTKIQTDTQCRSPESNVFDYSLEGVCEGGLDEKGFLIDHEDIDAAIQKIKLGGSCEMIAGTIGLAVWTMLGVNHERSRPMALGVHIKPVGKATAWFRNIMYDKYFGKDYIPLISQTQPLEG